jgi:aminopeptidase N
MACNGKLPYATKRLATRAMLRLHKRKPEGPKPCAYQCVECQQWHFGRLAPLLGRMRVRARREFTARCDNG